MLIPSISVLIIGTVWPEPESTAAGQRMLQLIKLFKSQGWNVVFASAANESEFMFDLQKLEVKSVAIELNNSSFDEFIINLNPTIVVFDRLVTEEQFGWRVAENCPNSLRILNTEDLHFLRNSRQEAFKKGIEVSHSLMLHNEMTMRELASIYRSDLSLIISTFEMELLTNNFKISKDLIYHLPFLLENITPETASVLPKFEERFNFVSIGNFRHEPNWNGVLYLKESIWPIIRKELPEAQLHIYGSYVTEKAMQLHQPKEGFILKGRVENADEAIRKARILLAPLRFGAGIKGKLTLAMQNGTPSITTTIGAEGMADGLDWNGFIENDPKAFAEAAILLFQDANLWKEKQIRGFEIINKRFDRATLGLQFVNKITEILSDIKSHRELNILGQILQHQTLKSTKFMSKWIEEKNKNLKH